MLMLKKFYWCKNGFVSQVGLAFSTLDCAKYKKSNNADDQQN